MIGFIRGIVDTVFDEYCFMDCNGIGYKVFIPASTKLKIKQGDNIRLYTYFHVRKDAMILYGFLTKEEYDLYLLLISINGIGGKAAVAILSACSVNNVRLAIINKDILFFTKIVGIGKKTAERIILELKDKIINFVDITDLSKQKSSEVNNLHSDQNEIIQALKELGYTKLEIMQAMKRISQKITGKELMKAVLKECGKNQ